MYGADQWGDEPTNSGTGFRDEINEAAPINDGQYVDYNSGAGDAGGVIVTEQPIPVQGFTDIQGERDDHWPFICRHLQQVKALSAGNFDPNYNRLQCPT